MFPNQRLPLPRTRNPQERVLGILYKTVPHKARQKDLLGLAMSSPDFLSPLFSCCDVRKSSLLPALKASCYTTIGPGWLTWIAGGKVRSAFFPFSGPCFRPIPLSPHTHTQEKSGEENIGLGIRTPGFRAQHPC